MPPESNRPRELLSWYLLSFGSSIYFVPVLSFLIPLLQDRLAVQAACNSLPAGCDSQGSPLDPDARLLVHLGPAALTPLALTYGVKGVGTLLQFLCFLSTSAAADYGRLRKRFLGTTSFAAAATTMLFVLCIHPSMWLATALLSILSKAFQGLFFVLYTSYLPDLVQGHPMYLAEYYKAVDVVPAQDGSQHDQQDDGPGCKGRLDGWSGSEQGDGDAQALLAPLFEKGDRGGRLHQVEDFLSSQLSIYSVNYGNAASFILTALVDVILALYPHSSSYKDLGSSMLYAVSLFICGSWWLLFSLLSLPCLRVHQGPDMPSGTGLVVFSWGQQWKLIRQAAEYPNLFLYLVASFLFQDGANTLISVYILYAKSELGISQAMLGYALLAHSLLTVVSGYATTKIQQQLGFSSKVMLLFEILAIGMVSIFGFYMQSLAQVLVFSCLFSLFSPGLYGYAVSFYSQMIPPGRESTFFGLQQLVSQGSSWIGPLVLAFIAQYSEARYGFLFIAGLMFLGSVLLMIVNVSNSQHERTKVL